MLAELSRNPCPGTCRQYSFWCWGKLQKGVSLEAFCCQTSQVPVTAVQYRSPVFSKLPALQELGTGEADPQWELDTGESMHATEARAEEAAPTAGAGRCHLSSPSLSTCAPEPGIQRVHGDWRPLLTKYNIMPVAKEN